jgi:hypothetical protein
MNIHNYHMYYMYLGSYVLYGDLPRGSFFADGDKPTNF